MDFLGMGYMEIAIVVVVAIIVLGPEKLPAYAKKASRFIRQFRKITSGLTQELGKALELEDEGEGLNNELKNISKSLEEDAAQLRKSLSDEADSVGKTVNRSVEGVRDDLAMHSADISESLGKDAKEVKKSLTEGLTEAKQNLGIDNTRPEAMVEYKPPPRPRTRKKA